MQKTVTRRGLFGMLASLKCSISKTSLYFLSLIAVLVAFSTAPSTIFAQGTTSAGVSGVVVDENGETLPGASVIAEHVPTGTKFGTSTGMDGKFRISNMRVGGPYTISVSFVGYRTYQINEVVLSLGSLYTLNAKLSLEDVTMDELVVTAVDDRLFNSDKTGASQNLNNEKITGLPTINRSINDFTRLTPQSNGTSFAGRDNRFNNYTIDGNIYNNNFGLGDGQFAGSNPISVDAIEEIQVNLAPYDVRQGGFTGANVNAITKSGSNTYQASVYTYYRNQNFVGDKIGDVQFDIADSFNRIVGATVGGALVKDKVFFFLSAEQEASDNPGDNRRALRDGQTPDGISISRVPLSQAQFVQQQMRELYGYSTGGFENIAFGNEAVRLNARLDWNINQNHRAMIRFNRFDSFRDVSVNGNSIRGFGSSERYRNTNRFGPEALTFSNTNYTVDNVVNSLVAEINSTFGDKIANSFNIGYTSITDPKRGVPGGQTFPMIEIMEPDASDNLLYYMSLGNELFTVGNLLENNVFNVSNNTTILAGKHTITAGFNFEYMTFANAFNPVWNSWYRYESYDDFVESVINQNTAVRPSHYAIGYTYDVNNPTSLPLDEVSFAQLGFYAQDEYMLTDNFKLTAGIRFDLPFYPGDLPRNDVVEGLNLNIPDPTNSGNTISPDVSQLPNVNPLISPRIGFNWDVNGDKTFQVRGGTGIFSGRLPFVWISNQVNANGVMRGQLGIFPDQWGVGNNPEWTGFQPNPNTYRPDPSNLTAQIPSQINVTAEDFKLPQVWRTSLAADKKFGDGYRVSVEAIYSMDFNSPLAVNLAHQPTGETVSVAGNSYQLFEQALPGAAGSPLREVYYLTNISKGSYASITTELEKTFDFGLFTRLAYTLSRSRDYGLIGGSQAQSLWPDVVRNNRNDPEVGFSRFDQPNRIVGEISFNTSGLGISKRFNTLFSLLYLGGDTGRFSYTYGGSFGDGSLRTMYVPNNFAESQLIDLTDRDGNVLRSAEQQWEDLNAFIEQDDYLSKNRGKVTERNGAKLPWLHRFDLRIAQDLGITKDSKNRLQLTFDVLNVGNFLNNEWGVSQAAVQPTLMQYRGADANGNAQFTLNNAPGTTSAPTESFRTLASINETWSAQFGVRFSFN